MTATTDSAAPQVSRREEPGFAAAKQAADFLRGNFAPVLILSALLLAPCYWHTRLEAGDLASHTYNAWLAQLVEQGKAPGLWIARQRTNILFDVALVRLGSILGLPAAEKIVVSAAVLIFFWGAFALVGTAGGRRPWTLVPVLAMLAYGWTFSMGFFNFYLSLGISFFGLALLWSGKRGDALLALLLAPLIWLAHPLGLAWLVPAAIYVAVARRLSPRQQPGLMGAAALAIVGLRELIVGRWVALFWKAPWFLRNGTDQLVTYSGAYSTAALLLLAAGAILLLLSAAQRRMSGDRRLGIAVPSQMYLLAVWALMVLPDTVVLPMYTIPATMIMERFSLAVAVLGCAMLAGIKPHRIHGLVFTLIALYFFGLYYNDTLRVNRMEQQAESLVEQLPPGQRVIATILPLPGARIFVHHIVDRACIGRCFSYGNYEPSSGQFRLRARTGNGMAAANSIDAREMQAGAYTVKAGDPPFYLIYQCDASGSRLCMRSLAAGESTGGVRAR